MRQGLAGLVVLFLSGCSGAAFKHTSADAADAGAPMSSCAPCLISSDCESGETCGQLPADLFCVRTCAATADCAGGQVCFQTTASGSSVGYCVAASGACSGVAASLDAGPIVPDAGSPATDAGPPATDAGSPLASSLTADGGGTVPALYFAAVGDTRPPIPDDDTGYPTAIITQIFADLKALSPMPPFVIGTGDYQYTLPGLGTTEQQNQLGIYNTARMGYPGIFWPAMGNHECGLFASSGECNCFPGASNSDALCGTGSATENYTVWFNLFITPLGESTPYYSRVVSATDGSWTAKLIFLAPNYWDPVQQAWFQQQLAGPATTYTFEIHHENATASDAPEALAAIESMDVAAHVTLSIVGHTHLWQHNAATATAPEEVICGNGGAPLDDGYMNYGYTTFLRQSDGSIAVTGYDYQTNQSVGSFVVGP